MKHRPGVAAVSVLKPRLVSVAVAACFAAPAAFALPTGPQVVVGSAVFSQQTGALTITNTPGTIINWQGFSIGASEAARFVQQSAQSSVLNRVLGPEASAILGVLQSNGRVWLVNPNGILFGPSARIDVQGLVASTLSISNGNFAAGKMNFEAGANAAAGGIQNQGAITTPKGGNVYLVAPDIQNSGIIRSPQGEVMLAAGRSVSLVDAGHPDVQMVVSAPADQAVNLGQILVDGGRASLFGAMLAQRGVVSASSVGTDAAGNVVFRAAKDVTLAAGSKTMADGGSGGTITVQAREGTNLVYGEVSAKGSDGKGGTIQLLGERVGLMGNASVDASGQLGGGTVLVGGDYQGKNPAVQNATATYVSPDATITANANHNGDGGKVIVWGNDVARMYGTISARGGAEGGDGGFIETSGHQLDVAGARVDTRAADGTVGMWLLDPTDVSIVHYGGPGTPPDSLITSSTPFAPTPTTAAASILSDYTINSALSSSGVVVTTSSTYGGNGNITFDASGGAIVVSNPASAPRTLNFNADGDIKFTGGSTTFQSPSSASILDVGLNPLGKVTTAFGSSVTMDGNLGLTRAWVALAKTWENSGTLSLTNNAALHIEHNYGAGASTFHNMSGGILNVASTQPWAIWSNGCCQDGILINDGAINVTASTAFEAAYSQSSSGTLDIANTKFLNLQNAISIYGGVNLNASGILSINENHGTPASLTDLTFSGTGGSLNVSGGKTANLSNVSAGYVALTVDGSGVVNVVNGSSLFKTATFSGGSLGSMTNGDLAIASGDFTVPAGVSYTGDVGYSAYGGSLTVGQPINATGTASSIALNADKEIKVSANLTSTGGPIRLMSNASGVGGYIQVTGASITSYGGHVTLDGGETAFAAGMDATNSSGVFLSGATLDAGGGNIVIRGQGYDGGDAIKTFGVRIVGGSQVKTSGSGVIDIVGYGGSGTSADNVGVSIEAMGNIYAVNGEVTVIGYGGHHWESSFSHGVQVLGGNQAGKTQIASQQGTVTVIGVADNPDEGDAIHNYGVYVSGQGFGGTAEIYGGTGATVTGYGGNSTCCGNAYNNYGVYVQYGGAIHSAGGIGTVVAGFGGKSYDYNGDDNHGVFLEGGTISSAGSVSVTGFGGGDGNGNLGVYVQGATAAIQGGSSVTVIGYGGMGSGTSGSSHGVVVDTGGKITSGTLTTVYGKAGDGAENGYGVYVLDGSIVSAGDVSVIGYGGDDGTSGCCNDDNYGVYLENGKIGSTSGIVTVTGYGGNSGDYNNGVYVYGVDGEIYGGSAVNVTGFGGGSGYYAKGVLVQDGKITSAGTVTVTGHGADGGESTNGVGVLVTGATAAISGGSFVTVTGYGSNSGYGSDNRGVVVADGGQIRSVSGMVMVTGYGGTDNWSGGNLGVHVTGPTAEIYGGGGVTITGIRDSVYGGESDIGVVIETGGSVRSAGTGIVTIAADTMSFYGGFISANMTTGEVRLQPYTNYRDVYLTGVKNPAALSLDSGDVDAISAGKLVIGPASGNTVGNIIVSYGGPVFTVPTLELNAYGDVTIDGALLQNSGAVNISGNNLIVQSATYGGVLIGSSITANMTGDISVVANANAGAAIKSSSPSGAVNLTTTGGGISLSSSGSNLAEIGTDAVSGTVSLTASPEFWIELGDGKVRAPTSLTLTTSVGGNVAQDAAGMVITPTLNLNTDGAVNLVGTANVIGKVQGAAYGGLTLYTVGPLAIGSPGLDAPGQTVQLGSTSYPHSTTTITQGGPITAATLNVYPHDGVNLSNTANKIDAFHADGGETFGNIVLADSVTALTLNGINNTHGGSINVSNTGSISNAGSGIQLWTAPSAITLTAGTGIVNTASIDNYYAAGATGNIVLNAGTGQLTNSGTIRTSGTALVLLSGIGIENTGTIAAPSMTLDAGTGLLNLMYGGSIATNAAAGVIGLSADSMNIAAAVTASGSIIVVPKSSIPVYLGTGAGLALSPTSVGNLVTPNLSIVGPSITVNAPVSSSAATLNLTTTGSFKVQPVTSNAYITAPTMNILAGSVTVYGGTFGAGSYSGWISALSGSLFLSSANDVTLIAGGAPGATTGGNAQIYGAPDVRLSIGGKLYLWGQPTTPTARVEANSIATVYLDFTTVESAGIVINGVDGAVTYGGSTGIFVDNAPAMPGAGLMLTYSNAGAAAAAAAAAAAQAAADAAAAKAAADAAAAKAAADKAAADAAAAKAAADAAAAQAAADAAAAKAAADAQAAADAAAAKAAAEAAAAKAAADKAAADAAAAKAAGDAAAAQAAADAAAKAAAAQAAAEAAAKAAAEAAAKAAADAAAKQAAADAAARAERDALAALEAATLKATTAKTEQKEKDEDAKKKLQLATKTTTTGPASDGTPKNYCNP